MKHVLVFLFLNISLLGSLIVARDLSEILADIDNNRGDQKSWKKEILQEVYSALKQVDADPFNVSYITYIKEFVSGLIMHYKMVAPAASPGRASIQKLNLERYDSLFAALRKKPGRLNVFTRKEKKIARALFACSLAVAFEACIRCESLGISSNFILIWAQETIQEQCSYDFYKDIAFTYIYNSYEAAWNAIKGPNRLFFREFLELIHGDDSYTENKVINLLHQLKNKDMWKK